MMMSLLAIKITDAIVKLKLTEPNVVLCFLAFEFKVDFPDWGWDKGDEIALKDFVARDFH